MNPAPLETAWTPLALLGGRLSANLAALAARRPGLADALRTHSPAAPYFITAVDDEIRIGVATADGVRPVQHHVPPASARRTASQMYPTGQCTAPMAVIGEDLGWLWNSVYQLPCHVPSAPGHRPPLYFLVRDLERLWVMLHVQDWAKLLADPRVTLFVGPDAVDQFRASLADEPQRPWPRAAATIDASLWPAGSGIDAVLAAASADVARRLAKLDREQVAAHAHQSAAVLGEAYRSGRPLKVLGITSRYTTFLQHSMRDWLSAFARLGHQTTLAIESGDHEMGGRAAFATAATAAKPDLIIVIDHYRAELGGLPANVPVVNWVQDALPTLFSPEAGAAQGPRDYSLGFGRLRMSREFGYPADRYMPAIVGLNEERFAPQDLSAADRRRLGGDVAFVSHASESADAIVSAEIDRLNVPAATRILSAIYDQLRAVYAEGGVVTEPVAVSRMIERALADLRVTVPADQVRALHDLFFLRVNNALFRHQSLHWLADAGVELRLWGRGWESHPTLKRFARGVADNQRQLSAVYQATKVNLQVTPHGAVHQRTMEGLAAGGFFLLRHTPGDEMELDFRAIWDWCRSAGVETDADLARLAPPAIWTRVAAVIGATQLDPFDAEAGVPFVDALRASADDGYIRSAATVWADDYDDVSYRSAGELLTKVNAYLADDAGRERVASSMRRVVLDRFTYLATTKRLLAFVANDLAKHPATRVAA